MIRNTQDNEKKGYGDNEKAVDAAEDTAGASAMGDNTDGENTVREPAGEHDASGREDEIKAEDKETSVGELKSKIAKKNEEVEALKEVLMRRQADFENYKKRMVKSQEEYRRQAIKDMSLDVIAINDNLIRAIEASESVTGEGSCDESHRSFVEGVTIISRGIEEMLGKYGVKEIESLNREFDPNHNEAVEIDESEGVESDTITRVYQKGFILDDLVIRPARVRVTRPARKGAGGENEDRGNAGEKDDDPSGEDGAPGDVGLN